jgi:lipopolysaccharide/colanic/teichoic acid biosynthesis glycosyltransferase
MTGLWQVSGCDVLSAKEMMALDVRYVHERTLRLDIRILLLTPGALLSRFRVTR